MDQVITTQADFWRIDFQAPVDGVLHEVSWEDISKETAEAFIERWRTNPDGHATFCRDCPTGPEICVHGETPEQRGWAYWEIHDPRVVPMSEAEHQH